MIKRISFVQAPPLQAPPGQASHQPLRVVVCEVLGDITPDAPHGGVVLEWFTDRDHLDRCAGPPDGALVVLGEEHVGRGADWLDRRWQAGGVVLKQMAIARRAANLTAAGFAELWRGRAGSVGAVRIPDEARGSAYVQNHPLPRDDGDWAYDAVNEVYFDDLAGLRTRLDWFAAHFDGEDDLVSESCFLALREELVYSEI